MKLITLLALLMSFNSFANLHQAPPSLDLSRSVKGVFVDFLSAKYLLTYDVTKQVAKVEAKILKNTKNKTLKGNDSCLNLFNSLIAN